MTTAHPDPIRGFTELTQSQSNQQHHLPGSRPFWFTENVLKFYVLLHDGSSNIKQSWLVSTLILNLCRQALTNRSTYTVLRGLKVLKNLVDLTTKLLVYTITLAS